MRDGLQQDVNGRKDDHQAMQKLEEKVRVLEAQRLANQTLLDKECAKYQSACRQQEVSTLIPPERPGHKINKNVGLNYMLVKSSGSFTVLTQCFSVNDSQNHLLSSH